MNHQTWIPKFIADNIYRNTNCLTVLLLPFSCVFYLVVMLRRLLYRCGILTIHRFPVPVIVVGNITVGGTGKTPFVIWLAREFKKERMKVGIVRRGYGVKKTKIPVCLTEKSRALDVGDESILIFQHANCPVVISSNRVAAIDHLLLHHHVDVVISDDGLQHYAMGRDIEVVLVDADREFGNGYCLPAGPLREALSRLKSVDLIVFNYLEFDNSLKSKKIFHQDIYDMYLVSGAITSVVDFKHQIQWEQQLHGKIIHAVAGIGNPERFFNSLRHTGLKIIEHPFPDHYQYKQKDIDFCGDCYVVMTEKDAVKCQKFADHRHWFIPVTADLDNRIKTKVFNLLKKRKELTE